MIFHIFILFGISVSMCLLALLIYLFKAIFSFQLWTSFCSLLYPVCLFLYPLELNMSTSFTQKSVIEEYNVERSISKVISRFNIFLKNIVALVHIDRRKWTLFLCKLSHDQENKYRFNQKCLRNLRIIQRTAYSRHRASIAQKTYSNYSPPTFFRFVHLEYKKTTTAKRFFSFESKLAHDNGIAEIKLLQDTSKLGFRQ